MHELGYVVMLSDEFVPTRLAPCRFTLFQSFTAAMTIHLRILSSLRTNKSRVEALLPSGSATFVCVAESPGYQVYSLPFLRHVEMQLFW
jgi:hypothetical protein